MKHTEVTVLFCGANAEVFHAVSDLLDELVAIDSRCPDLVKSFAIDFVEVNDK